MAGESYTWIDSTATSRVMDGVTTDVQVLAGPIGLYMPPTAQLDQRTPGQPGTIIRYTDLQAKIITLPLHLQSATESDLDVLKAELVDVWFANPGTLRRTRADGTTQRDLICYYLAGLEMDESDLTSTTRALGWIDVALQLLAPVPFWSDPSATSDTYTNTQMGAGQTIANGGAYRCYPVWTIHGPFSAMTITNTTTGLKMALTASSGLTLGSSDSLVIDASAGTIILNGTTDERSHLTTDSVFFPLEVGNNAVTFGYGSGSNGVTATTVSFKQRYRSP